MITVGEVSMNIDFQENEVIPLLHGSLQLHYQSCRHIKITILCRCMVYIHYFILSLVTIYVVLLMDGG